jgi:transposase
VYILTTFTITLVRLDGPVIWLEAEGSAERGDCPTCGAPSAQLHDRYVRRPFDRPWHGRGVRLRLTVRRFRCATPACPRQAFAEDCGPALARYARRTVAAAAVLLRFAIAAGGEAGARLAQAVGLPVSPDTLLRLFQPFDSAVDSTPRVLRVDDLALRRRHRYATLFVDLETRRPVDLVPERDAETLATGVRAHPGVEIIVRDRSEAYAEGACQGAPDALQIADRFHLVQNAGAALEELLRGRLQQVTGPLTAADPPPAERPSRARAPSSRPWTRRLRSLTPTPPAPAPTSCCTASTRWCRPARWRRWKRGSRTRRPATCRRSSPWPMAWWLIRVWLGRASSSSSPVTYRATKPNSVGLLPTAAGTCSACKVVVTWP